EPDERRDAGRTEREVADEGGEGERGKDARAPNAHRVVDERRLGLGPFEEQLRVGGAPHACGSGLRSGDAERMGLEALAQVEVGGERADGPLPHADLFGGCWLEQQLGEPLAAHARARDVEPLERSEEHTSELQSRENLVCRLLLEKKKN